MKSSDGLGFGDTLQSSAFRRGTYIDKLQLLGQGALDGTIRNPLQDRLFGLFVELPLDTDVKLDAGLGIVASVQLDLNGDSFISQPKESRIILVVTLIQEPNRLR